MYPHYTFDSSVFCSLAPLDRKMAGRVLSGHMNFISRGRVDCMLALYLRIQ